MMTITLPKAFWIDRKERELPMPRRIGQTKRGVTVSVDDPALDDYLSDADYYSDIVSMSGDSGYIGLQASARASVKAIRKARA